MPENIYINAQHNNYEQVTEDEYKIGLHVIDKRGGRCIVVLSVLLSLSLLVNAVLGYKYHNTDTNQGCELVSNLSSPVYTTQMTKEVNKLSVSCSDENLLGKWVLNKDRFYVFHNEIRNWIDSRDHCQALKGDLVIIKSKEEQEMITGNITLDRIARSSLQSMRLQKQKMHENIYCNTISRTKQRSTKEQRFSNKRLDCIVVLVVLLFLSLVANAVLVYLHYSNEIVGCEPVTNCSEPDVEHDAPNMWIHPKDTEDWTAANYCPEKNFNETWVKDRDKVYVLSNDTMNWNSSRERCQALGGDLVIISSEEEQNFIAGRINPRQALYWIGLTDSHMEGKWMWVDNTPLNERLGSLWTFTPDNYISAEYPDGEDCVVLNGRTKEATWGDVSCLRKERRICELLCS